MAGDAPPEERVVVQSRARRSPRPSENPYTIQLFGRDGTLLDSFSGNIPQGWGFARRKGPMIHSFRFIPGDPGHGLDDVRYTAPGRAGAGDDDSGGDGARGGVPAKAAEGVAVHRRRIFRPQNPRNSFTGIGSTGPPGWSCEPAAAFGRRPSSEAEAWVVATGLA